MCARDGLRRNTRHARPELYASTPPLEALKVVLSEIATSEREGKVLALVDVRKAYFYAPGRRAVFVELLPEDYQPGDEHMCGLPRYNLYGTRDAAQKLGRGTGIDAQRFRIDEEKRVPVRVERPPSWQPSTATTSQSVGNGRQWSSSWR